MNRPASPPEVVPLRARLPQLAPELAAAQSRLFRSGETLDGGGDAGLLWRFAAAPALLPPAVLLRCGSAELLLGVINDGLSQPLGEREWWDYSGASRLLAWTLAHGALLEGLGRLLGAVPLPQQWHEEQLPPAPAAAALKLAFTALAADGRRCSGSLRLPPALCEALAAHPGWRAAAPLRWARLPATLRIEFPGFAFAAAEILAAGVGDILSLGGRAACWRRLTLALDGAGGAPRRWNAGYDGRAQLSIAPPHSLKESPVNDAPPRPATADAGNALDSVPLLLDFELGRLSLTLAELAALQPGYVFQLGGRLEDARVTVRANGVCIGQGELVAVGDTIGVQLMAFEPHGLR